MRRLWSSTCPVSHRGEHFAFQDVTLAPPPARPVGPPIWLAGGGGPALRRVARLADGWLPYQPEEPIYAKRRCPPRPRRRSAAGLRAVYQFRIDGELLHARVDDGTVEMSHGPAQRPDAVIEMDEDALLALAAGRSTLRELIDGGRAALSGNGDVLSRLGDLFRLPSPRSRTAEHPPS